LAAVVPQAAVCDVAAFHTISARAADLKAMRQGLESGSGESLPASSLKHLDEQTLAGLAAVYGAIRTHHLSKANFTDWAVLAAPRFLGRAALIVSLQRYAVEGAWGMSPHFIPHRTLHSVSGTVSMALKIHGPNFGIDGGPAGPSQALLTAVSLLGGGTVPGVWLLLTGWDREPLAPLPATDEHDGLTCRAVAMALLPSQPEHSGFGLRIMPGTVYRASGSNGTPAASKPFGLEEIFEALASPHPSKRPYAWRLSCGGKVELRRGEMP
jgi:hypothetical protein